MEQAASNKYVVFPYSISAIIIVIFLAVCKIYYAETRITTTIIGVCCFLELLSWITFIIICFLEKLIITKIGFIPAIIVIAAILILIVLNIGHYIYYRKHITDLEAVI